MANGLVDSLLYPLTTGLGVGDGAAARPTKKGPPNPNFKGRVIVGLGQVYNRVRVGLPLK